MLKAGNPHFLTIDHIAVAALDCRGFELGGVGAGGGFGHCHGLQSPFTGRYFGKVMGFLLGRAMAQQGAHVVHLTMA